MQFVEPAAGEILILIDDLKFRQLSQRGDRHNQIDNLRVATLDILKQGNSPDEQVIDLALFKQIEEAAD